MKKILLIFPILFMLSGFAYADQVVEYKTARHFLAAHPDINLQIDDNGILDKYKATDNRVDYYLNDSSLVRFYFPIEVFITDKYQRIGDSNYFVKRWSKGCCDEGLSFKEIRPSKSESPKKENVNLIESLEERKTYTMEFTLGTWIVLIFVMFLVAILTPKLSLKMIFRPLKEGIKKAVEEWKNS